MRLRRPLLALTLLGLLVPSAVLASVRASGLLCSPTGGATVSSLDGRRLSVSNLGSSGQDGVDISLSRVEGHHISSSSLWTNADVGAECSWSFGASHSSSSGTGSPASSGRVMIHRIHNGQRVSLDLSEFSSTSPMTLLLYLDGALVSSVSCPSSTTFELSSATGSSLPVPECGMEFGSSASAPNQRQCLFNIGLKGRMVFSQGGSPPVECDRLVGKEKCDDGNDLALDGCSVRVTRPATSSLSSVEFDSQSFVRFGVSLSVADLDCDGSDDLLSLSSNPLFQASSMSASNPLFSQVFGSGGGGGGGGGALSSLDRSLTPFSLHFSKSSPLLFRPNSDEGSSFSCTVVGTGTCSPTGEIASLRSTFTQPHVLELHSSFAGMCADQESVFVSSGGLLVASFAMPPSRSVFVQPPPGGPLGMAINEKGLPGEKKPNKSKTNNPKGRVPVGDEGSASSSVVGPDGLSLHVSFADPRVVCVDGTCVTGDDVTFHGACSSGTCSSSGGVITITGQDYGMERCSSGACSPSSTSLHLTGTSPSGVTQVRASIPPSVSLSSTSPVAVVPVLIDRFDNRDARGASVTLHLSSNLVLAAPMVEYDYFSRFGSSQMFVVDNGGGSYTVDAALLGPGCGPSSSGTLFSLSVARAPGAPDGVGSVSIDAVELADCTAGAIPASSGGAVYILLDSSAPAAPTLVVTQATTGNDASGVTRNNFQLGSLAVEDYVELYRAPFGNYPEYDDGPAAGSAPPMPAYPPSGRWSPVALSCATDPTGSSACSSLPPGRDFFYYVAYVRDRAGNVSPASSMTSGTLSYHLGDVAGGGASCVGDNQVTTADISALGAAYGASFAVGSTLSCLDVGPTSDGTVLGRPLPDQRLSFRDLILYAINFSLVSMPAQRPSPAAVNALRIAPVELPAIGQTFEVSLEMDGAGDVQGLSAQLGWDPDVVEAIAVTQGPLLERQDRLGMVLSPAAGVVDAALFGAGGGIAGSGTLARVTFRMRAAGDPAIHIASVDARDGQNRALAMSATGAAGGIPGRTALRMAFPNPFDENMTIALALSKQGPASVSVFDVAGRKVRSLVDGVLPAGERLVTWDGRDDNGARLGAGVYMLRLDAGGHSETRAVRLVK